MNSYQNYIHDHLDFIEVLIHLSIIGVFVIYYYIISLYRTNINGLKLISNKFEEDDKIIESLRKEIIMLTNQNATFKEQIEFLSSKNFEMKSFFTEIQKKLADYNYRQNQFNTNLQNQIKSNKVEMFEIINKKHNDLTYDYQQIKDNIVQIQTDIQGLCFDYDLKL